MVPKISILLPVYNAAKWLPACLDSILHQTFQEWELIAINDFSEDESHLILSQFAQKDSRIKVYKNTAKGIIPALRLAYEKSTAELITRMDADDKMVPQKLERLYEAWNANGKGHLVTGLVEYFAEDFELQEGYKKYAQWLNELSIKENNFDAIYKECVIPSPCWLMHREDLEKCEAFEPDIYPEDYDLCFRFYKNNLKIVSVKEVLHLWRDHADRSSRTQEHYSNQRFFDLKLDYFLKLDYYHSRPIVIWGAGKKGKTIAQKLRTKGVNFIWVCNNPNKVGKEILDVKMANFKILPTIWQPQIIITVAAPDGKKEIQEFLDQHGYELNYHYFYFV